MTEHEAESCMRKKCPVYYEGNKYEMIVEIIVWINSRQERAVSANVMDKNRHLYRVPIKKLTATKESR